MVDSGYRSNDSHNYHCCSYHTEKRQPNPRVALLATRPARDCACRADGWWRLNRVPTSRTERGAFAQRVEPGSYPVWLVIAEYFDPGNPQGHTDYAKVAAARLVIRNEPVTAWRVAVLDG
ncbi:MAG: DUF4241 domain-containing protein, partial [Sciscionella sp.]